MGRPVWRRDAAAEDPAAVPPFEGAENVLLRQQLRVLLARLPQPQRLVLEVRYGLTDGSPRTLGEVSDHSGTTRERVRQLERAALLRLREAGYRCGLDAYLPAG